MSALVDHFRGTFDLHYTSANRGIQNLIGAVSQESVFKKRKRDFTSLIQTPGEKGKIEEDREVNKKVSKKLAKMQFVNGIETSIYYDCVNNEIKLKKLVDYFLCFNGVVLSLSKSFFFSFL